MILVVIHVAGEFAMIHAAGMITASGILPTFVRTAAVGVAAVAVAGEKTASGGEQAESAKGKQNELHGIYPDTARNASPWGVYPSEPSQQKIKNGRPGDGSPV